MSSQTEAIIYLSDQRGCTQSDWYRSYHTFNFGTYFSEYRNGVNDITFLNDETLKSSCSIKHLVEEDTVVLLMPLIGGCCYKNNVGIEESVDVGQSCLFNVDQNKEFEISNPFESELINYIYIGLHQENELGNVSRVVDFNLDAHLNSLVVIFSDAQKDLSIRLGKFKGRREGIHKLNNPTKGVFVFVIEGAFEVHNRLLQSRDGLFLNHVSEIDFEALSNEAILLLIG